MAGTEKLKITIDCEDCIGDGACVEEAPETFAMDDDDKAYLKSSIGDSREDILAAAETCPIDIITVVDGETGEQLYPEQ